MSFYCRPCGIVSHFGTYRSEWQENSDFFIYLSVYIVSPYSIFLPVYSLYSFFPQLYSFLYISCCLSTWVLYSCLLLLKMPFFTFVLNLYIYACHKCISNFMFTMHIDMYHMWFKKCPRTPGQLQIHVVECDAIFHLDHNM